MLARFGRGAFLESFALQNNETSINPFIRYLIIVIRGCIYALVRFVAFDTADPNFEASPFEARYEYISNGISPDNSFLVSPLN